MATRSHINRTHIGLAVVFVALVVGTTKAHGQDTGPGVQLEAVEWTVTASDVEIFVRAIGGSEGSPALVLIHGGPQFSHHYMEALEVLASAELTVVNYDQRGVGASTDSSADTHDLAHHVSDLEAVRVALGVEQIHVLGHSWGGLIAMAYAIEHSDRVTSLTLVDSIPPSRTGWLAAGDRFVAHRDHLVAAGLVSPLVPELEGNDCAPQARALFPVYMADPSTPATPEIMRTSCYAHIYPATWDTIGDYDLTSMLEPLTLPVHVVHGELDPFGIEMADEIRDALAASSPGWSLLPECGHFPWIECPEPFFESVGTFLDAAAH